MEHDPLCIGSQQVPPYDGMICECDLIAKVREDALNAAVAAIKGES